MEKRVIIEGDEKVVNVIMRENKVRAARGLVKFTPVGPEEKGKGKVEEEEEEKGKGKVEEEEEEKGKGKVEEEEEEKGNRRSSRGKSTELTDK